MQAGKAVWQRRRPEASALYRGVQVAWATVCAGLAAAGRSLPRLCVREVEAFLRCGIVAHGFLRVWGEACRKDDVVAFSCKGRGFCPSCGARRMADTAAWLVDRVIPEAPVRQWVLSLPYRVRHAPGKRRRDGVRRHLWAELLRRVLEVEVLVCEHCGGRRRLLAAITAPKSIARVLSAMGLSSEVPELAPARAPPGAGDAEWGA